MSVQFSLFGRLAVVNGDRSCRPTPVGTAVLARLLLAEGRLVTVAELYRAMRPDHSGPLRREHRVAVQQRIMELRRLLHPRQPERASPQLRTERGAVTAYQLIVDRGRVDLWRFVDLVRQARALDPGQAGARYQQALALWVDEPLMDVAEREFARDAIAQLNQLRAEAVQPGAGSPPASAAVAARQPVPPSSALGRAALVPRQLPVAVRHFVGRTTELHQLSRRLDHDGTTVLVLSGGAGIGKTTLAVHWAHRAADQFPDGQLYADLRGFDPSGSAKCPTDVIRAFLDALGVPPGGIPTNPAALTGLYRSMLAGRRMLILLDNARNAEQIRPLLPGDSACLVIVTSRDQLTGLAVADQAQFLTLQELSAHEAAEFLSHRLGPHRLAVEADTVQEIIGHCAGLPLALAVAAARTATSNSAALAAERRRADHRLEAFTLNDARFDLRSVFSWSYHTLSEPAARLFRRLGLHPGPHITREAAASLSGTPVGSVDHLLNELRQVHLITESASGRYHLHNLLHVYARELAQTEDGDTERHDMQHLMLDPHLRTADVGGRTDQPGAPPATARTAGTAAPDRAAAARRTGDAADQAEAHIRTAHIAPLQAKHTGADDHLGLALGR